MVDGSTVELKYSKERLQLFPKLEPQTKKFEPASVFTPI
jgi:hypothetical protein